MPKIGQTVADIDVRAHTFRFISPGESEALKIPNPCIVCHSDKTLAWAAGQLNSWKGISPWRMAN
jgi:hypothetical protein